jgi:pimeloyl-ACP methyl ester carboxylesterase
MKTIKTLRKLSIFLCLLFLFHAALFAMKPHTMKYEGNPNHSGLQYREIDFYTSDAARLKGWFIPTQDYKPLITDEDGDLVICCYDNPVANEYDINKYSAKPTIILCNSDAGNMSYLVWIANEFSKNGFNTFLFDWRGFGESQSWEIIEDMLCIPEFLIDYEAAIETVSKLPEVDSAKICAYGFSTGFYLTFAAAVTNPKLKCIAGRALLTNFEDILKTLSVVYEGKREVISPENYPEELMPINCADKLNCPIYMLVGELDDRTPVWMSEKIYAKIKSPKKLQIIKGKGHSGIESDFSVLESVCDFFKENLK